MPLEAIDNRNVQTISHSKLATPSTASPRRQRIISESTGLVKFNLTRKLFEEREQANREFEQLEAQTIGETLLKTKHSTPPSIPHKRSYLQLAKQGHMTQSVVAPSPLSSPVKAEKNPNEMGLMDEELMLELASKQRELLELKSSMDQIKKKIQKTEKELQEIEQKCNRATHKPTTTIAQKEKDTPPEVPQRRYKGTPLDQFTTLRSKPSLQTIKASIEYSSHQTNHNITNLTKKISMQQLRNKASLINFAEDVKKDTNQFIERGLSFVNTLKSEMFMREEESDFDVSDGESDISDYGCADASNYQLAVK